MVIGRALPSHAISGGMVSNGKNIPHKNSIGMLSTRDSNIAVFSESASVASAIPIPIKDAEYTSITRNSAPHCDTGIRTPYSRNATMTMMIPCNKAMSISANVLANRNSSRLRGVSSVRTRVFWDLSCMMVMDASMNDMNISTIDMMPGIRNSSWDLSLNTCSISIVTGAAIAVGDFVVTSLMKNLVFSISNASEAVLLAIPEESCSSFCEVFADCSFTSSRVITTSSISAIFSLMLDISRV